MEKGAGIILVRFIDGEPHILGLRIYGSYDLPKGRVEEGESVLDAAVRETQEEAGVTDVRFPWGHDTVKLNNRGKKEVTLFLGITDQEPKISKNPQTGEYEHQGIKWLTLAQAESKLHPYLRPAAAWVRQRLETEDAIRSLVRDS